MDAMDDAYHLCTFYTQVPMVMVETWSRLGLQGGQGAGGAGSGTRIQVGSGHQPILHPVLDSLSTASFLVLIPGEGDQAGF
jgi:hypothetical protein